MRANAEIARGVGIAAERILIADDGMVIDLVDGTASITGYVPVGFVYVDGSSVGDVTENLLKDRLVLGEEGFISIFAAVDLIDSKVVVGPEIHARGLGLDDEAMAPLLEQVRDALEEALRHGTTDPHELQQLVRPPDDRPGNRGGIRPEIASYFVGFSGYSLKFANMGPNGAKRSATRTGGEGVTTGTGEVRWVRCDHGFPHVRTGPFTLRSRIFPGKTSNSAQGTCQEGGWWARPGSPRIFCQRPGYPRWLSRGSARAGVCYPQYRFRGTRA
jgi:hypothetical protein